MRGGRVDWRDVRALRVALGQSGLSQPGGWLPFTVLQMLPAAMTSTGTIFAVTISRPMVIRTWYQSCYIVTTNDGSNYWEFSLYKVSTSGSTLVTTLDTSALSVGTQSLLSDTGIDESLDSTISMVDIRTTKVGSPGALSLRGPAVFVT